MKVLGTAIEDLSAAPRSRTVVVSDLHLPADPSPAFDWLEDLLERAARSPSETRVVVLGDLFDVWVSDAQLRARAWSRAVAAIAATTARGVDVLVAHGNRDYMLGARFASVTGCRIVAGGLRLALAGRDALLLHGDELCTRDLPYQRAKRWLRHPLTRGFLRVLPARAALFLAARARAQSRAVQSRGTRDSYEATAAAIEAAFATSSCDVLVHGHVHRAARTPFGGTREVLVLPAFDEAGVHLVAADGTLGYRDRHGAPLPDYPPQNWR